MSTSVDGISRGGTEAPTGPISASPQTPPVGASPQPSGVSFVIPVTPTPQQQPVASAVPSDTPAIFETPTLPKNRLRRIRFSPQLIKSGLFLFGVLAITLAGLYFVQHKSNSTNNQNVASSDVSAKFKTINIPLSDFENSGQINIGADHTLSINGQLQANNSLVITPTPQPSTAVTGQIYYNQTANQLEYYNGTKFVGLLGNNAITNNGVQSVGGVAGALSLGSGLAANGQQLSNSGVLSVQGQAGNINFTSGSGIAVNGTTLSNSGLLSLGGQNGAIALGNGLAMNGSTLSSTGVQSLTSATPSLVVTNDGNGNLTIANNGGGSGTVSSLGGTSGSLAVFTGTQVIANSLVSESGSNVTVTGNLVVSGSASLGTALSVADGGTGATTASGARTNLGAAASGANSDITSLSGLTTSLNVLQGGTGVSTLASNGVVLGNGTSALTAVAASSAGQCLISTASAPTWQSCPGAAGVTSVNGLTGALTIANASVSGSTITINDASTSSKGIASFNSTNFSVGGGTVNTIQDISTAATPTFAGINTNSITPSGTLTVGATTQSLALQGSTTTLASTSGANTTTLAFDTPTSNVTYKLQAATAGTYDICTTAANCAGVGGSVTTPGGTSGQLAKFTGSQTIGSSIISDNGTTVTVTGNLTVTGSTTLDTPLAVVDGGTGAATASAARGNLGAAASGANSDITSLGGLTTALSVLQGGTGVSSLTSNGVVIGNGTGALTAVATGTSGQCLMSTAGAPSWQSCPGSGGTSVTSVNGLSGALTIANAASSGSTITINNATTSSEGIASFNSNNFSVTAGAVNTIQDINVSATPTFGALTLSSSQASSPMLLVDNTNTGATGNLLDLQVNGTSKLSVAPSGSLTLAGTVNGQTISSAANFTGTLTVASTLTANGAANLNGGATVVGTLSANTITPSGAMTLGATGQNATLQGATVSITSTSGASTTALNFVAPTANVTYRLQTAAAGTYNVCTTVGNCAGVGGGVTTSGGTTGQLAKFVGSQAIGNSIISDNGSTVTIAGSLAVNTITPSSAATVGATGQNLTLQGASVNLTATSAGVTNTLTFATPSGSSKTITIPNATGTVAVSASGPLQLDASGNLTCPDCLTSGGGGGGVAAVDSVDSLTGALTLANSVGSGTTITINNASTSQLGLAQFNSTNFTASAGVVNTVQDINTTAAPTFGRLTVSSSQAASDMFVINNTNVSGTGKLLNVELNGAGRFTVDASGNVVANGSLTSGAINGQTISSAANFTGSVAVAGAANLNGGATVVGTLSANTITPSAALTVGATGQNLTLQGATTNVTSTSGANTTTLALQTPTANVTYRLLTAAAGTYDVCTTVGNCAGVGGGVTTPGGTTNDIAKFSGSGSIVNSGISDDSTTVSVGENLSVSGTVGFTNALTVANGGTGTTTASGARTNLGAAASGANSDITSLGGLTTALSVGQGGTGATSLSANGVLLGSGTSPVSSLVAGSSNLCLVSTAGAPTWAACPGSGGVTSVDGLNGVLTLANSSGTGSTVTINTATSSQLGIASFNASDLTVTAGTVDTIQGISTSSSPTFATQSLTSSQASADMLVVNNTNASGTGNLINLKLNSTSKFSVAPSGSLTLAGTVNGQTISSAANFTGTVAVASTLTATGAANLNGGATVVGTLSANTITPSSALTIGSTGQNFTLQGSSGSTVTASSGGNTTTLGFATPTANVTYQLQTAAAGTYNVCTTAGNCTGVGGGVTTAGGTANTLAKFTASQGIGNSGITDNGTTVGTSELLNQSYSGTTGSATTFGVTDSASSGATTLSGVTVNVAGTNNASGSNAVSGISLGSVSAATNNSFYGINFGTGMTDLIRYNGTQLISGAGLLQNAAIDSTLTYSNLQKVGALVAGSIGTGFGTISTGNTITTTSAIQGASGIFTGASSLTIGTASTNTGTIIFNGSGSSATVSLQGPTTPNAGNFTLSIPALTANASICTSIASSGCSLQQAYNSSTGGTTYPPTIKLDGTIGGINIQDADTTIGTSSNFLTLRSSNGGNGLLGTTVFGFGIKGQYFEKPLTDTSTAFQVENGSAGNTLFDIDSSGDYINIGSTGGATGGTGAAYNGSVANIEDSTGSNTTTIIGSTAQSSGSSTIDIGYTNTAGGYSTVNIGSGANATGGTTTIQGNGVAISTGGSSNLTLNAGGTINIGSTNASSVLIGQTGIFSTIQGTAQIGGTAGTGGLMNQGTTLDTVNTQSFAANGSIANGDSYSAILVTASNSGLTLTLPNPTTTTAGKILYISNASSGSNMFTLSPTSGTAMLLNVGATATMIWNGSAWTAAGANASSILNQNTTTQTANFLISGNGTAGSFLTTLLDTPAGSTTLNIGTTNATAINLQKATTVTGNLAQSGGTISLSATGTATYAATSNASFTSSGSITITANGSSTWSTTGGNLTLQASGTNNLNIQTAGAGTIAVGQNNTTTIDIGEGSNIARTIAIGDDGTSTAQTVTLGSSGSTSTTTIKGGTGSNAISLSTGTNGSINLTANGTGGVMLQGGTGNGVVIQGSTTSYNALRLQNSSGVQVLTASTATGAESLTVGNPTTSAGQAIAGKILFGDGTTDGYTGTLQTATLTNYQTYTLPNVSGTFMMVQGGTPTSQTGGFNVSGTGIAGTALEAPDFDTASASALILGQTNATSIQISNGSTGNATPVTLVLNSGNVSSDPSGVVGAMYYNAATGTFRCDQGSGWTECLGMPTPNTARTFYSPYSGGTTASTGTYAMPAAAFPGNGDTLTATSAGISTANATSTLPAMGIFTSGNVSGNTADFSGATLYNSSATPLVFQTYFDSVTTSTVRDWIGLTDQTSATMHGSTNPTGNYVGFRFDTSVPDTSYQCVASNGTSISHAASGVSVGAHKFEIDLSSSSAVYKIDGATVCTISTNLPTANTNLRFAEGLSTLAASAETFDSGWVYMQSAH